MSTYRSEPDGARALYLLSQAHRLPLHRVQQSLDLLSEQDNLVLLAVEFSEKTETPSSPPSSLSRIRPMRG